SPLQVTGFALRVRHSATRSVVPRTSQRSEVGCTRRDVASWHKASVHCDAPVWSLLRVKRTCRRGRTSLDPTRLTQMYGPAVRCKRTFIELADVRSCINVSGL